MEKQFLEAEVKVQDDKIVAVASTGAEDREGEVLAPEGWDFKEYKKNPVILWAHSPSTPPIGQAKKVWIEGTGKRAKLMIEAVLHEVTDLARDIKALVNEGIIKSLSVGFLPLEQDGNRFTKQELLEVSFVPVGANAEARIIAKNLDIISKEIFKEQTYNCECLDCGHTIKSEKHCADIKCPKCGGEMRRAERPGPGKDAKSPACRMENETEDKCVSRKIPELKKEGMSQDQAVAAAINMCKTSCEEKKAVIPYAATTKADEGMAWDAGKEVRRAETSQLKKMCTWYDSENPDAKSSYKLPHHTAEGTKVVWRGVAAAMGALLGARGGVQIPEGDKKGVYNHLAKHYAQFEKTPPDFKMVEEQVLKNEDILDLQLTDLNNQISDLVGEVKSIPSAVGKLVKETNSKGREGVTKSNLRRTLQIIDKAAESALKAIKKE